MHLYNTRYARNADTATPQFQVRGNSFYLTSYNKNFKADNRSAAMYQKIGNNIYQTSFHPDGKSLHPVYEIKRGGVFRTIHHKDGHSSQAEFKVVDSTKRLPPKRPTIVTKPAKK